MPSEKKPPERVWVAVWQSNGDVTLVDETWEPHPARTVHVYERVKPRSKRKARRVRKR